MALANEDILLSNKSYVNKDFRSIYDELLSLCKDISNRYDPETSNESDPMLVLLKLLAATADKLHYNIDKNVLENFISSATQETSIRNICEMNAYNVSYYNSAITDISFMYTNDLPSSFSLQKYSTVVSSEDSTIKYTLINDCIIGNKNVTYTAKAIEGTVTTLNIGDSTVVHLNNLDDNNRLYLPDLYVAENGIFIEDLNNPLNTWKKVDYLNTQELNQRLFKFGFDSSSNLPYIEFPSDISSLIGAGLTIRYVVTSGIEGNISANTLTKLVSPASIIDNDGNTISDLQDYLSVNNLSATFNGKDIESIDEAYNNYKKIAGTFNTLVTCRDYANFIYNLEDEVTFRNIVSNIVVADRRDDFNYSNNVLTYEPSGGTHIISNTDPTNITAFDLCMYPLKPVQANYNQATYEDTFKPLDIRFFDINDKLKTAKCLSHDQKELDAENDVYCFKNYYTLRCTITAKEKLDVLQQEDLLTNVKYALYKNFNARQVNFGQEVSYDTILSVIENADVRISQVILQEPTYETVVMNKGGVERSLFDTTNATVVNTDALIAAKNVLSGRIALLDLITDFNLQYGQIKTSIYKKDNGSGEYTPSNPQINEFSDSALVNVKYASTEVTIKAKSTDPNIESLRTGYTLKENEILQFISKNLTTSSEYGTYINYRLELEEGDYIPANSSYKLKGNDKLYITYTDTDTNIEYKLLYTKDGVTTNLTRTINKPIIICPNFDLYKMDEENTSRTIRNILYDDQELKYWVLSSSELIDIQDYVTTTLDTNLLPCYWITNNQNNKLFDMEKFVPNEDNSLSLILQENEYFMYANSSLTDLVILGSGTQLTLTNIPIDSSGAPQMASWIINEEARLNIEDINDKGLAAFSDINWQNKQLAQTPIIVDEMNIVTFTEGDLVTIIPTDPEVDPIIDFTNSWQSLSGYNISGIRYGETAPTTLKPLLIEDSSWFGKSRLDLSITTVSAQPLINNQKVTLTCLENNTDYIDYTLLGNTSNPVYLAFDYNVQFPGSADRIDICTRNISGIQVIINEGLKALYYTKENFTYPITTAETYSGMQINLGSDKTYAVSLKGFGSAVKKDSFESRLSLKELQMFYDVLIMLYYEANEAIADTLTITCKEEDGRINLYNSNEEPTRSLTLQPGLNIIRVVPYSHVTELYLDHENISNDMVYISTLTLTRGTKLTKGLNGRLFKKDYSDAEGFLSETVILEKINQLAVKDGKNMFYYLSTALNDRAINFVGNETLFTPLVFWEPNNIVKDFTIGEIDFNKSSFVIDRASQK